MVSLVMASTFSLYKPLPPLGIIPVTAGAYVTFPFPLVITGAGAIYPYDQLKEKILFII